MYKVIIIEDERIIRQNLVSFIDWKALDCQVVAQVSDAAQAYEFITSEPVDIVVSDINLPDRNALEMLQDCKDMGKNFEIILVSGYSQFEYAKKAIELNVIDYILKPVDEQKVEVAVRKAIDKIIGRQKIAQIEPQYSIDKLILEVQDEYVSRVLYIIRNRYTQYLSVPEIAKEIGISTGYLSCKIKQETGESFLDLHHRYRIEKAIELLKQGKKYKHYEIAKMVGFPSYKRFANVFKAMCGYAPRDVEPK